MILAGQVAITHWRGAQIVYTVKAVSEKDCCFGMQGLLLPVSLCLYCYLRAHLKQKVIVVFRATGLYFPRNDVRDGQIQLPLLRKVLRKVQQRSHHPKGCHLHCCHAKEAGPRRMWFFAGAGLWCLPFLHRPSDSDSAAATVNYQKRKAAAAESNQQPSERQARALSTELC